MAGYAQVTSCLLCLHHKAQYLDVYPLTSKTGVLEAIQDYMNRFKDFKEIQADMDGVFRSASFQSMVRDGGKLLKYTTPHRHEFHPEQRYICTVMHKSRSMLADSKHLLSQTTKIA